MTEPAIGERREHWSSKGAFLFGAIGSAIGLGNIWRFPRVCAENGGAAFLVAYVVALFTTGIPLLILELAIGQRNQKATPICFARVSKKLEPFGWFIVGVGFVITIYYAILMSWSANYFVLSFTEAWTDHPADFFRPVFLRFDKSILPPSGWGQFVPTILVGSIVSWVFIKICIWNGVKTVSKVVFFTVLIPWLLLIVFVIRGLTLDGATDGLKYYLGATADWRKLYDPQMWLNAYTQVFFSLFIGFGIMFAYGSFLDRRVNIVGNAFIIGIADSVTAFVGGLAVFAALGFLQTPEGGGTKIATWTKSGLDIAFVAYPTLINKLGVAGYVFGPLFFLMLLTLAVDSAFSLVESVIAALEDKFGWTHRETLLIVCYVSFLLGIPLMFQSGLVWLDTVDHFMNHFGLAVACFVECLVFGYVYKAGRIRRELHETPHSKLGKWWDVMVRYVSPAVLLGLIGYEVYLRVLKPYGPNRETDLYGGWLILAALVVGALLLTVIPSKKRSAAPAVSTPQPQSPAVRASPR